MSPLSIFILIIASLTGISGICLNSFIVFIFFRNWRQKLSAGDSDKIVLCMTATTFLFQCLIIFGSFVNYLNLLQQLPVETSLYILISFLSLIDVSFWNTSWLSMSYCLKLVNVSHRYLLCIKSSFPPAVTGLLIASTLGSILINLPFRWTVLLISPHNGSGIYLQDYGYKEHPQYIVFKTLFGSCLPFCITLFSIVVTVTSLLKHVWRNLKNTSPIKYSQLKAHVRAARTLTLRVLLELVFCVVSCLLLLLSINVGVVQGTLNWIFIMLYPSLQSIILIVGSPMLKKHIQVHLHYFKICRM